MKSMGARPQGERLERIAHSPRWRDGAFRNLHPIAPGLRDPAAAPPSLTDFLCNEGRRVPTEPLPAADPRPGWLRPADSGLRATWLGHSTVLIEIDGWRILTDPVWGRRASPFSLIGPRRFQPIPVALRDMPACATVPGLRTVIDSTSSEIARYKMFTDNSICIRLVPPGLIAWEPDPAGSGPTM